MSETRRDYKVFGHLMGLMLLELLFWGTVLGVGLVAGQVAPNLDLHYPEHWPALLVAPLGLLIFAGHYHWKSRVMSKWMNADEGRTIWPNGAPRRSVTRFVLWRTGVALIGIALLDPVVGMRREEVEAEGIDVMIALDVSRSMLTEDVGMDRLALGKRTIERLMDQFEGDRVGLVVFAGDAFVQTPITMDLAAVSLFLDAIDTETIPTQGTAIGWAIDECVRSFDPESEASRVIIVLTDGENHEDDAVEQALAAHQDDVQIHTIGMASEAGGAIPEFDMYGRQHGFKAGPDGQPIVSMLDEALLIAVANAGAGTYTRAASGYVNIDPVIQAIGALDGKATAKVMYTAFSHRFATFIGLGLFFLLLEMCWPAAHLRRRHGRLAALAALLLMGSSASAQSNKAAAVAGSEAFQSQRFGEADSLFARAGDIQGLAARLAMNRGHAQFRDGDSEGAIRQFQQAAQQSEDLPMQADAWSNIGNALAEGEMYPEALEAFKQSLRIDPSDQDTRQNLAAMMQLIQQQEQQEQQEQDGEQNEDGEQQEQDGEQQEQDGEQQEQDGEQQEQDGEQQEQDGEQNKDGEQQEQDGEQNKDGEEQETVAGQMSAQDAARILESLERQEAAIRARLQVQENNQRRKAAGKSKIEKDW